MKNVIIFTNDNGGVSVCIPTGELPIEQVQAKDIPAGVDSFIVSSDTLPENYNDFFNAWEQTNGVVTVNLDKAKAITQKMADKVQDQAKRAEHQNAIDGAKDVKALAAIVETIKQQNP